MWTIFTSFHDGLEAKDGSEGIAQAERLSLAHSMSTLAVVWTLKTVSPLSGSGSPEVNLCRLTTVAERVSILLYLKFGCLYTSLWGKELCEA